MKALIVLLCLFVFSPCYGIGGKGPMEVEKTGLQNRKNPVLDKIGIDEKLGDKVDLNLPFIDDEGKEVLLGKYFTDKPVFLMLIYYECPTLCNTHLNSLIDTFKNFEWTIGKEFELVAVSIDPDESTKIASRKKEAYVNLYERPESKNGWHFLTGSEESIKALANQVGFRYAWDPREQQWAHGAAAYVLTPKGKISYYHYGVSILPKVLRLSLVEAGANKIGTILDRMVLFCLQYDPTKKTYAFYAFNVMRAAGVLTIIFLAIYLFRFWYKENKTHV